LRLREKGKGKRKREKIGNGHEKGGKGRALRQMKK